MKTLLTLIIILFGLCIPSSHIALADTTTGSLRSSVDMVIPENSPFYSTDESGVGSYSPPFDTTVDIEEDTLAEDITSIARRYLSYAAGGIASIAGIFALFMILKNAFLLATAEGDSGKIQTAAKGVGNALIGLLIISFSYMIVYTVINTVFTATEEITNNLEQPQS